MRLLSVRESKACARILPLGKRPKIFLFSPPPVTLSPSKKNLSLFHLCLRLFSQVHANYQRENIRFPRLLFPLSVSSNRVRFPFSFLWVGGNKCCMHPYISDLAASSPSLFKMPRRDLSPYFTFFSFPWADGDISPPSAALSCTEVEKRRKIFHLALFNCQLGGTALAGKSPWGVSPTLKLYFILLQRILYFGSSEL